MRYEESAPKGNPEHASRDTEYKRTRGNFPSAEVRPSLLPRQTNEVQLRIVQHQNPTFPRKPADDPVAVTWSAGYKFPKVRITREEDPEFCAVFASVHLCAGSWISQTNIVAMFTFDASGATCCAWTRECYRPITVSYFSEFHCENLCCWDRFARAA
jgi:hypothetical protein